MCIRDSINAEYGGNQGRPMGRRKQPDPDHSPRAMRSAENGQASKQVRKPSNSDQSTRSEISNGESDRLREMLDEKVRLDGRDAKILFKWIIPNTVSPSASPVKPAASESPGSAHPSSNQRTFPPSARLRRPGMNRKPEMGSPRPEEGIEEISMYDFLFFNLDSAVNELYNTLEHEHDHQHQASQCQEAVRVMEQCTEDFKALITRLQVERRATSVGPGIQPSPVAWELRKTTGARPNTSKPRSKTPINSPVPPMMISTPMIGASGEEDDMSQWLVPTHHGRRPRKLDPNAPSFECTLDPPSPTTPEPDKGHFNKSTGKGFVPSCPPLEFIPTPSLPLKPLGEKGNTSTGRRPTGGIYSALSGSDEERGYKRRTSSSSEEAGQVLQSPGTQPPRTWAEVCVWKANSRNREIHVRLSSVERRSPATKSSLEERHANAQRRREQQQMEKEARLKEQNQHAVQVAAANREKKERQVAEQDRRHASAAARHEAHVQDKVDKAVSENKKVDQVITHIAASQRELREKLDARHASAAAQRDAHLQDKVHKAVNENKKVDEIMFIEKLSKNNEEMEREQNLRRRIRESEERRALYLASVRQRALQISTKEEKVAERKRLLELERTSKIEQAEQRRLAARERREAQALGDKKTALAEQADSTATKPVRENEILIRRQALAIQKSKRRQEAEERRSTALSVKESKAALVGAKVEAVRANRHRRSVSWDLSLIHISEPTRLLSISYAVFCLKKKKQDSSKQRTDKRTCE
eukprot:TRINITY_DN5939_c0_g1_i1.p1 TRINITY_DN5939_c0_g1~~TRINITY_DN5939_c0_g1_i1.p1  ORF type:complete len:759 (-),score=169.92 TRINITY_DN5939_c0_g1_i1:4-2280(-)